MDEETPPGEAGASRRDFLRGLAGRVGKLATKEIERRLQPPVLRFVRPPGAQEERWFLKVCTRCGDCLPACPHGAIFLLGDHTGPAAGSPALDLTNKACHLCPDFPCVAACEPGALLEPVWSSLRFSRARIDPATCLPFQGPECGVCVAVCPVPGAIDLKGALPEINPQVCTGCAVCRQACVVTPSSITMHPLEPVETGEGGDNSVGE